MMTLFEEIRDLAESTDNDYLRRARDEGREIVGLYCSYVPEELLHAAGAIPYRMRGVGSEGTNLGDTWFSSANCSFVRRLLDQGLKGGFDFLSGIVFMNGCDHNRRLYDNWRFSKATEGFTYMLFVPYARQKASQDQYVTELTKLKHFLEDRFETAITHEALTASIALYNTKRALLTQIAETRRAARPSMTGTEFLALMHAVVTIPVEDAIPLLERVLAEVTAGREVESAGKLRVIVTGSCVEELSHLELLEAGGALVVSDAICLGARHYEQLVSLDGDPLVSIAQRYLGNLSCPRMMDDFRGRMADLKERTVRFNADAVIVEKLEFCSMMSGESYIASHELRDAEIPSLTLTRELYGGGVGQLRTRVQAFYEKVINRK